MNDAESIIKLIKDLINTLDVTSVCLGEVLETIENKKKVNDNGIK